MSKIEVCDICGQDLELAEMHCCTGYSFRIQTKRRRLGTWVDTDICPDCVDMIRDLAEKKRKEREEKKHDD